MDGQVIGNLVITGSSTAAVLLSGFSVWRINHRQRAALKLETLGCIPPPDAPYEAPLYFPLRLKNTGDVPVTIQAFYLDLGRSFNARFTREAADGIRRHQALPCVHTIYRTTAGPGSSAGRNQPLELLPDGDGMAITLSCHLRYARRNDGAQHRTLLERLGTGRFSLLATTSHGGVVRLAGAALTFA